MSESEKCVCGDTDVGHASTMSGVQFRCYGCGLAGPYKGTLVDAKSGFVDMQRALKHFDAVVAHARSWERTLKTIVGPITSTQKDIIEASIHMVLNAIEEV